MAFERVTQLHAAGSWKHRQQIISILPNILLGLQGLLKPILRVWQAAPKNESLHIVRGHANLPKSGSVTACIPAAAPGLDEQVWAYLLNAEAKTLYEVIAFGTHMLYCSLQAFVNPAGDCRHEANHTMQERAVTGALTAASGSLLRCDLEAGHTSSDGTLHQGPG